MLNGQLLASTKSPPFPSISISVRGLLRLKPSYFKCMCPHCFGVILSLLLVILLIVCLPLSYMGHPPSVLFLSLHSFLFPQNFSDVFVMFIILVSVLINLTFVPLNVFQFIIGSKNDNVTIVLFSGNISLMPMPHLVSLTHMFQILLSK